MTCGTAVALCLLLSVACSGLILERLPRHIPTHKSRFAQDSLENDDLSPSFDASVEKRKIIQDPNQLAPLIMKPTWKAIYPFSQEGHIFNTHKKRAAEPDVKDETTETSEKERHELVDILKDEEQDDKGAKEDSKKSKDKKEKSTVKHNKTKRQSSEEAEKLPDLNGIAEAVEEQEEPAPNPDFQDWLRREYYRNMAKSFASMRRKRDGSSHDEEEVKSRPRREKRSKKSISFEEVTDNLRAIEDVLFLDALQTIREAGDEYDEDVQKQRRITNDLSSAYDLETMRNALFRLKDTLGNMEQESAPDPLQEESFRPVRKRGDQCPPLELLTSDCSSLGDIVPDGPLKRLLLHACNWHEVCYTCGEVFGLTSENCDVGFVEQSQTICRGDVPCESTASLLLLPLRQRRVFYKRSNPNVCLMDTCVEDFLRQV